MNFRVSHLVVDLDIEIDIDLDIDLDIDPRMAFGRISVSASCLPGRNLW